MSGKDPGICVLSGEPSIALTIAHHDAGDPRMVEISLGNGRVVGRISGVKVDGRSFLDADAINAWWQTP